VAAHIAPQRFDPDQAEKVSVGIPQIDAEHRQLIDHYNALLEALQDGRDLTAFGLSFYSFVLHVGQHFKSEEQLMRDFGYPGLQSHKAEHQKLLATAKDFLRSVLTRFEESDCSAVAKYFKYWLIDHVIQHDRAFAAFALEEEERLPYPVRLTMGESADAS
jgi:hemerythrin